MKNPLKTYSLIFLSMLGISTTLLAQAPQLPSLEARQFWIYQLDAGQNLSIKLPWDAQSGASTTSDPNDPRVPDFARTCLTSSEESLKVSLSSTQQLWSILQEHGASMRVMLVINVLPKQSLYRQLASIDREPYFWHWNEDGRVPGVALSNYRRGSFVWEVVASPERCMQPPPQTVLDYLNYAARRLSLKR